MTDNGFRGQRSVIQGLGAGALLTTIGCAPATRSVETKINIARPLGFLSMRQRMLSDDEVRREN